MNSNTNPYLPPASDVSPPSPHPPTQGLAIGGWLILPAIGVVISPLRITLQVIPLYQNLFASGQFQALISAESPAYNPGIAIVVIAELLVNCGQILAWLYLNFLFFTKKRKLPSWYIGLMLFSLGFQLADLLLIGLVAPDTELFDADTVKDLSRTAIGCAIWIPYMLLSKRVKATFVH